MTNKLDNDLAHILKNTKDILQGLNGMRILLTGGTGFFGKWLLETFSYAIKEMSLDLHIIVLSRNPEDFKNRYPHLGNDQSFTFLKGDITDFSFAIPHVDLIIHAATEASAKLNQEHPLVMIDSIVEGTRNVLEYARQKNVNRMLFISSGAVYGKQPFEISHISEDYRGAPDTSDPLSAYGEGKRVAELLGSVYWKNFGLQFKIARCFAFVGPYLPLDTHFAIGNFILNGINNTPIYIKGNGTPLRSYFYASDLIIWLLTILDKGKPCYPYNVGSEESISITDLATLVSSSFIPCVPVERNPNAQKASNIERYVPSCQRAMRELGLKQHVTLFEGLQKTIRFYKG